MSTLSTQLDPRPAHVVAEQILACEIFPHDADTPYPDSLRFGAELGAIAESLGAKSPAFALKHYGDKDAAATLQAWHDVLQRIAREKLADPTSLGTGEKQALEGGMAALGLCIAHEQRISAQDAQAMPGRKAGDFQAALRLLMLAEDRGGIDPDHPERMPLDKGDVINALDDQRASATAGVVDTSISVRRMQQQIAPLLQELAASLRLPLRTPPGPGQPSGGA